LKQRNVNEALTLRLRFVVSIYASYKLRLHYCYSFLTFDLRSVIYFRQGSYFDRKFSFFSYNYIFNTYLINEETRLFLSLINIYILMN